MALPSNIYSGGAVTFNSLPYTNLALQNIYKKQAKEDALDNYFRDFNKSINPAGMRTQDIEGGWMNKVNGWTDFYTKNRQAIQNPKQDNGKAYNQYLAMHNDLLADVERSKNEAQKSTQYVVPIVSNPDKRTRLGDNSVAAIHSHDLSIYDPNHKSLDPSILDYSAKPFDIAAQRKLDQLAMANVKMSNSVPDVTIDKKTGSAITSYHSEYSNKDLQEIGGKYAEAYGGDDSFQNHINDIAESTPDVLEQYNKVFKSTYGKDIQSNQDLAAAYGLSRVQSQINTQKRTGYTDPYLSEYLREQFYQNTQGATQADVNSSIDQLVDNQIQTAKQGAQFGELPTLPIDPATLNSMGIGKMILSPDGELIPVYNYTSTVNGQEVVTPTQGTPITIDQWKAALGKRNVGSKYFQKPQQKQSQQKKSSTKANDPLGIF